MALSYPILEGRLCKTQIRAFGGWAPRGGERVSFDIIDRIFDAGSQPMLMQIGLGLVAAGVLAWYFVARSAAHWRKQEAQCRAEDNARRRDA